jgi:hypothetical protein
VRLLRRVYQAFNAHDIEGARATFHGGQDADSLMPRDNERFEKRLRSRSREAGLRLGLEFRRAR